jgi:hypothetical protein
VPLRAASPDGRGAHGRPVDPRARFDSRQLMGEFIEPASPGAVEPGPGKRRETPPDAPGVRESPSRFGGSAWRETLGAPGVGESPSRFGGAGRREALPDGPGVGESPSRFGGSGWRDTLGPPEMPDGPDRVSRRGVPGGVGDAMAGTGRPEGARRVATTRRMLYTIAGLLALTLGAAGVAYARTGGDGGPSAASSSAPVTSAEAHVAKGPTFFDPLSGPGRFRASSEETGSCGFDGKALRVRSAAGSTYQCRGPVETFSGAQTITVQVTLSSGGSCAMVWFRHRDLHGYELTACSDSLELVSAGAALPQSIGRVPSSALEPGTRHEVAIAVAEDHATVSIDGTLALQGALNDSTLTSVGITLGVTGSSGAATVQFANLDVR